MSDNSRIDFISAYADKANLLFGDSLIYGLVGCLGVNESCKMLDPSKVMNIKLRRALLKKISRDIDSKGFLVSHQKLLTRLMKSYDRLPYKRKQGCGYCIKFLAEYAPRKYRIEIINFFGFRNTAGERHRAYMLLRDSWQAGDDSLALKIWDENKDSEFAWILVKNLDIKNLKKHWESITDTLSEPWQQAKLFLRLTEKDFSYSKIIQVNDEITHIYILYKLGKKLSIKEAKEAIEKSVDDDRFGLLLWCLGQMGHWEILKNIAENQDSYFEKAAERFTNYRETN